MKLMSDSGLWSTGPFVAPSPLQAVLEVSGAVLSWTVDDPCRRSSDHVHRPGQGGLAVAGARRGRAPCGRVHASIRRHPMKRTPST